MDLAAPEMRSLIDMRFRPHLRSQSSFAPEATSARRKQSEADAGVEAGLQPHDLRIGRAAPSPS
jgi:hypothetical protein